MDRSRLSPELRKIYEELDTLDFKVTLARETPGLYSDDEIDEMASDLPKRLAEVADELQARFAALPEEVRRQTRERVHHGRDMSDVHAWIEHMSENVDWLEEALSDSILEGAEAAANGTVVTGEAGLDAKPEVDDREGDAGDDGDSGSSGDAGDDGDSEDCGDGNSGSSGGDDDDGASETASKTNI